MDNPWIGLIVGSARDNSTTLTLLSLKEMGIETVIGKAPEVCKLATDGPMFGDLVRPQFLACQSKA